MFVMICNPSEDWRTYHTASSKEELVNKAVEMFKRDDYEDCTEECIRKSLWANGYWSGGHICSEVEIVEAE